MRQINADALKEEITQYFNDVMDINEIKTINTVISIIDNAPTVEPERPQGNWIKQYGKIYELKTNEGILVGEFTKCPKCQYDKARGSNFCPNCGAQMI